MKDKSCCFGLNAFLFGVRLAFGIWLLYVGLNKWVAVGPSGGPSGFTGYIVEQFSKTWVPGTLSLPLAWIIIIAEPLLGLWLLIGKHIKLAWIAVSLLMFQLLFGQTILGEHATVANIWQYLVLALFCAAYSPVCSTSSCSQNEGEQKGSCCG